MVVADIKAKLSFVEPESAIFGNNCDVDVS